MFLVKVKYRTLILIFQKSEYSCLILYYYTYFTPFGIENADYYSYNPVSNPQSSNLSIFLG